MAVKTLSIEIGETMVKICEIETSRGKPSRIAGAFTLVTPVGCVTDGQIGDTVNLAKLLNAALAEHGIKERTVNFSLISGKVATREVTLPSVKPNKIRGIVEMNAGEYFPVDITKYQIAYSVLENVPKGENAHLRLIVMAVPRILLEGYFRLAELLHLQITNIDYTGNSIYRILSPVSGKKITAYVTMDATTCFITVLRDGNLMFQRFFPCGGDDIVQAYIASRKNASEISLLRGYLDLSDREQGTAAIAQMNESDVEEALSRVIGNIARTVDFFNSNNWENPAEKLVVTGLCSRFEWLRGRLEDETSLPTEMLPELGNAMTDAKEIRLPNAYLSCVGGLIAPVDLLPDDLRKKGKKNAASQSVRSGVLAVTAAGVLGLALVGTSLFSYFSARQDYQRMNDEIKSLEYVDKVYLTYTDYHTAVTGIENFTDQTKSPNAELLAFIAELEKKMPSSIRVLSAVCDAKGVSMNITVESKKAAAETVVQLRTFQSLGEVAVGDVADAVDENGIKLVSFSVTCAYGANPYLAAAPVGAKQ